MGRAESRWRSRATPSSAERAHPASRRGPGVQAGPRVSGRPRGGPRYLSLPFPPWSPLPPPPGCCRSLLSGFGTPFRCGRFSGRRGFGHCGGFYGRFGQLCSFRRGYVLPRPSRLLAGAGRIARPTRRRSRGVRWGSCASLRSCPAPGRTSSRRASRTCRSARRRRAARARRRRSGNAFLPRRPSAPEGSTRPSSPSFSPSSSPGPPYQELVVPPRALLLRLVLRRRPRPPLPLRLQDWESPPRPKPPVPLLRPESPRPSLA